VVVDLSIDSQQDKAGSAVIEGGEIDNDSLHDLKVMVTKVEAV
jgi:hypothetical protein